MHSFPSPAWHPSVSESTEWILERVSKYLDGKPFSLFKNGTCRLWKTSEAPSDDACAASIRSVVAHHPDFKVRRHPSGDFLITFRGGLGGVMSGKLLTDNFDLLRREAFSLGKLPGEEFQSLEPGPVADDEMVAGLYVRALLYLDAKAPHVIASRKA
jgi:hypothetical protein